MAQEKKLSVKNKILKVLIIVVCSIAGFILFLMLGIRIGFRVPISEYYKNSEKAFLIPGISDGMIHQGLAYDDENDVFLITGYKSKGKASQISIVSKSSGKEIKRLNLANEDGSAFTGHVGGITLNKKYIYLTDDKGLFVFNKADFISAQSGETVKPIGLFKTSTNNDRLLVAFAHVEGDEIYLGEFYRKQNYPTPDSHKYKTKAGDENPALMLCYKLDDTAQFGISEKIERAYSIPALVQGMCFDKEKRLYLSTSYALAFSHIRCYNAIEQEGDITVLDQNVPLYALDGSTQVKDYKFPPMSEEIVIVDEKLYTMCESATNKYIFGKFTSAKYCYATDLSKYN